MLIIVCFFFLYSASGTSAVAIDNKIEQAMVSNFSILCHIYYYKILYFKESILSVLLLLF